jgi:hypothetical protein
LTSVQFVVGQLPPVFFYLFYYFIPLVRNLLHWNIKGSGVSSSCSFSPHRHIRLSVSPNLWRYDLIFPCPVSIVVNSGNAGIFCRSLFLIDGKKLWSLPPFPIFVHCHCYTQSPFSFSYAIITSLCILPYTAVTAVHMKVTPWQAWTFVQADVGSNPFATRM